MENPSIESLEVNDTENMFSSFYKCPDLKKNVPYVKLMIESLWVSNKYLTVFHSTLDLDCNLTSLYCE